MTREYIKTKEDGKLYNQDQNGSWEFSVAEYAARDEADAAHAAAKLEAKEVEYKQQRAAEYPSIEDQLDIIYNGGIDAWKAEIKKTKDKYPKPAQHI